MQLLASNDQTPSVNPRVGVVERLGEFFDLFPTIQESLGKSVFPKLKGTSFAGQLLVTSTSSKVAVISRWHTVEVIKTDRYALTEWFGHRGQVTARMLLDHLNDPRENVNLTEDKGYKAIIADIHGQLIALRESR